MTNSLALTSTEVWGDSDGERSPATERRPVSEAGSLTASHVTRLEDSPTSPGHGAETQPVQPRASEIARLDLSRRQVIRTSQKLKSKASNGLASVWTTYRKEYEVDHGSGYMWVASRVGSPEQLVLVESCAKSVIAQKKLLIDQLRGDSFVRCVDIFDSGSQVHVVLEHMSMSLVHLVTALRYPSEQEVRAIVGQMLKAYGVMARHQIVHGQVQLSTVLVNLRGEVKLMYPYVSSSVTDHQKSMRKDVQDLGQVVCDLTRTTERQDRRLASRVKGQYSDAMLDLINSARTGVLESLMQLPFVTAQWHHTDLVPLTSLAASSSRVQLGQIVGP